MMVWEKHNSAPVILPVLETTRPRQSTFSGGAKIACWMWRVGMGLLGNDVCADLRVVTCRAFGACAVRLDCHHGLASMAIVCRACGTEQTNAEPGCEYS
ncbi:hypothetical protein EC9_48820 [Rosistilla ulvae]|uniref:Uncharacterized protein n=1 Tax=Rosistilla ulvae TaxID=1930277 RepID=A0A517M708_9BACT|nr:hypothetical protein EC9_48820 [Rosistilla ulvae]